MPTTLTTNDVTALRIRDSWMEIKYPEEPSFKTIRPPTARPHRFDGNTNENNVKTTDDATNLHVHKEILAPA